jgi:hypothetical protein
MRREVTTTLNVWVWTHNPVMIPRAASTWWLSRSIATLVAWRRSCRTQGFGFRFANFTAPRLNGRNSFFRKTSDGIEKPKFENWDENWTKFERKLNEICQKNWKLQDQMYRKFYNKICIQVRIIHHNLCITETGNNNILTIDQQH